MARGAGASGWGGGRSGAGGAKGRREEYQYSQQKPFSATELNITGTEKQVSYARDIVQGAFNTMDANIKRNQDLAKNERRESGKQEYLQWASDWKEFKSEVTSMYRQNATRELKASDIISTKYRFQDGVVKDFDQWRRAKGKNR